MELSDEGISFIATEEGVRNSWYKDQLGVWTIGIGHVWNPETDEDFANRALTDDEVWDLFRIDVARYVHSVNQSVKRALTQTQFDRLVSFAFNWGISPATGFPATSVVQLLNAGDFTGAARELVEGHGPSGRPYDKGLEGVRNRRIREAAPFRAAGGTSMKFVSRSEWGARSPGGRTSAPGMTRGVGVHWLGPGSSRSDHAGCAAQMREVQAFHMGLERGWADFAYNAAACRHGYVFEGRGPKVRNAANGGGSRAGSDANAAWASILYLEGTDGPGLTPEGQDAINDAAEWLGVAAGEWLGHRDFLGTECPGDRIYGWVHSGHPRSTGTTPTPAPQEDDIMIIIGDAPPERGGGVWQSDGVTRKPVRTGDTWAQLGDDGAKVAKHIGVFRVGTFDDLIDIEAQLASLRPAPVTDDDVEGLDTQAVADLIVSKLGAGLAGEVADLLAQRLAS